MLTPGSYLTAALAVGLAASSLASAQTPTTTLQCAPSSQASDTTIYDSTSVTQRAQILRGAPPHYPDDLRARGISGMVLVAVYLNAQGDVDSAVAMSASNAGFAPEAVKTVLGTRFAPACIGDHAVRSRWLIPVRFAVGRSPVPTATPPTICAGSVSTDTGVYDITETSEAPSMRLQPVLVPLAWAKSHHHLHTMLSLVVNANGAVDPASIVVVDSAHTPFDSEAVVLARATTFWPGCRYKDAVRVRIQLPIDLSSP